ncbi:uncharacterized protein LOC122508920 [Leptopilina heterotoma]|uniref:uncharacterized protein LOC122508920 n=1 Tax=Leptopilina heterotoma TaxID=63436 RepID=UPI001CAA31CC|nr:uncharacterized protein LOC122508920 [Leptopilina heterotoma]
MKGKKRLSFDENLEYNSGVLMKNRKRLVSSSDLSENNSDAEGVSRISDSEVESPGLEAESSDSEVAGSIVGNPLEDEGSLERHDTSDTVLLKTDEGKDRALCKNPDKSIKQPLLQNMDNNNEHRAGTSSNTTVAVPPAALNNRRVDDILVETNNPPPKLYTSRNDQVYLGGNSYVFVDTWYLMLRQNDSKFVRDVASILWGTNVLKKRCLKLTKAMEERDKDMKCLTPQKYKILKDSLRHKLKVKNVSPENIALRMQRVWLYMSRFIYDCKKKSES